MVYDPSAGLCANILSNPKSLTRKLKWRVNIALTETFLIRHILVSQVRHQEPRRLSSSWKTRPREATTHSICRGGEFGRTPRSLYNYSYEAILVVPARAAVRRSPVRGRIACPTGVAERNT